MSIAPTSAGVEQIIRPTVRHGDGAGRPRRRRDSRDRVGRPRRAGGHHDVPERFAWLATNGATADLALFEQRTCGPAPGFQWSRT
ncbi:hypothetical protein [Streptomyces sp. TLI_185]|uniref:hypothetical protein n=1 Tax=Streptomyces sp. TLI_185 TaxID=2485151 RepID=UPI000F511A5B|nr:hypothetical protein [Streptomyces sp. TLI_185]RPF38009.1 hypothetical protein EDD92_8115 [Streptomyces sp. TLI_185]